MLLSVSELVAPADFVSFFKLSFSAQTLQNVLAEDSGHYLAFSLMFLSARQRLIKMKNIFTEVK